MKHWADSSKRDLHFNVDEWVYVHLRTRRKVSVTGPFSSKLQKRYFGPFQITNKIDEIAYDLALPTTTKIHNVFHVCLFRPHKGPLPSSPLQLPSEIHDNQPVLEPTAIIDWKRDSSSMDSPILVLVQWHNMPLEEASWEPWSQFKDQFQLEDKVLFKPGEMLALVIQYLSLIP